MQLKIDHISKSFPGVRALDAVVLTILAGELHALCGENGAGKSTLMNILAGHLQPDSGAILLNDIPVVLKTPRDAFAMGIAVVYQHLSLVDNMSVAENIFANQQPRNAMGIIQFDRLYANTTSLLQRLHLDEIKPGTMVSKLSPAQKQMVEIAKALARKPRILILDEPTASLTEKETKTLFEILHKLKDEGTAIVYISHRLEEVFILADKISVLKDGKYQGTFLRSEMDHAQLIKCMVGREIDSMKSLSHATDEVLLTVKGLTGRRFQNITFSLHKGEILGFAGLVGAGRTEIARAIFGADSYHSGKVSIRNEVLFKGHPSEAVRKGLAYVPEERKRLGLFPFMSIQDNIVAADLKEAHFGQLFNLKKAKQDALHFKTKLRIGTADISQKVIKLSGGNQQKVVLGKWLLTNPDVLIIDEPTHGIDVGAKSEIYEILKSLAKEGKAILMISSDLPELIGICDRILVISKGNLAGEVLGESATEEIIMNLASTQY